MNGEERTSSAESENSSTDNGYVKVTQEDAKPAEWSTPTSPAEAFASPIGETTAIPSCPEEEHLTIGDKEESSFSIEEVQV